MSWFKRKVNTRSGVAADKLAGKIAGWILKLQEVFATKLAKYFNRLPASRMKVILVILAALAFSFSICLIVQGIFKDNIQKDVPLVRQIKLPVLQERSTDNNVGVRESSLKELELYQHLLDSLSEKTDPEDKDAVERLASLADSIRLLKDIYLSQIK